MPLLVVRGRTTTYAQRADFEALAVPYSSVTVDLIAGDGRSAYKLALARPEERVIAVTLHRERVADVSAKAARHREHGGAPNLAFVVADPRQPPPDLGRIANQILMVLPKSELREGILLGDDRIIRGIVSVGAVGATVSVVIAETPSGDPFRRITPLYTRDVITPALAAAGARVRKAAWMSDADITKFETKWTRSLPAAPDARLFHIEARIREARD